MKQKGFTLIELLAVIVVLAIIAIIAIPVITNVIDKAKKGALKDSAYGILDAAEMYLAKNMSKERENTLEFICSDGVCLSGDEQIDYKGKIDEGKIRIYSDNKIELCITDNKYSALKKVSNKDVIVAQGACKYDELEYEMEDSYIELIEERKRISNERDNYKNILDYFHIYTEYDEENNLFLTELIPYMTSSTEPFGVVIYSGSYGGRDAYRVFDYPGISTNWDPPNQALVSWVGYQFPKTVKIKKAEITMFCNASYSIGGNIIFQISNDGVTWTDVKTSNFTASLNKHDLVTFELDEYVETTYIRYYITSNGALNRSGLFEGGVLDAQVYGSIE